ncbi:hypothetical protein CGB80_18025 [Klebsiella sp. 11332]|nr:hypothetical protein [Klebsiella sp. CVUAS 11332]
MAFIFNFYFTKKPFHSCLAGHSTFLLTLPDKSQYINLINLNKKNRLYNADFISSLLIFDPSLKTVLLFHTSL